MKRNRKEEILLTALRLFSHRGYEGTSMRDIAGELGIRQSSLYKHFSGKQAILDGLVARMDAETARWKENIGIPSGTLETLAQAYGQTPVAAMVDRGEQFFRYWTEDAFAAAFRRLLTLEQYRDAAMSGLYHRYLIQGVLAYHAALFAVMIREGYFRQGDPAQAALAFYGPIFMLMNAADHTADHAALVAEVRAHIGDFGRRWANPVAATPSEDEKREV